MMIKSLLLAGSLSLLGLASCVKQDEAPEGLRRAIPTADQVAIKLPGDASRTVGQLADWYVATRNVTRTFNGGSAWVLILVHTIVQFPVTSVDDDVYTWGPWSGALDPAEYKLDVRDVGDGTYEYQLSGRSKTQPAAQFEVVIAGVSDPRLGELKGNGEFLIDFDASRRVNPIVDSDSGSGMIDSGEARGTVIATYDLTARHLDLAINSRDVNDQPVLADYAYNETVEGGGDMTFAIAADTGGGAGVENATLRSRWLVSGSGRADGRVTGGDLGTDEITASECWDTQFRRSYYIDSANFQPTEGDLATCAFASPDLPPAN
ncbi:MAG: hypothetical protein H0T79_01925 [Deltaproteobacteria bacterium]|nr:hypothetical protein [Deltaproteobacteria bacterium]